MAITDRRLATGFLQPSLAVVLTAPAATTYRIMHANLVNLSGSEETYSLWAPAEGASASDANVLTKSGAIPANFRKEVTELKGLVIEAGCTLQGLGSTANVLTLELSGLEIT